MELVFILIGLLFATLWITGIPYMVYGNWNQAIRSLKRQFTEDDGILGIFLIFIGLMLTMTIFITLCAMNNSIWHIDYWTTEGLWKNK